MAQPRIDILITATHQGFKDVLDQLQQIQSKMQMIGSQATLIKGLNDVQNNLKNVINGLNNVSDGINKATSNMNKFTQAITSGKGASFELGWSIKSIIADMEKLLQFQARWYATKALLTAVFDVPVGAVKNLVSYNNELENSRASMLRWSAAQGDLGPIAERSADTIMLAMRKALTQYPVELKKLSSALEAFVGAGVSSGTVAAMTSDVAKLVSTFKEINMDQFAIALTGAVNAFRDKFKEGVTEAQKFRIIIDQMMAASGAGLIRPEQFTKVMQYLSGIGSLVGFTSAQIIAMSTSLTNLAIPAASAGRLLATLFQTMSQKKARETLAEIGVQIDKNKTISEQFFTIVEKIRKALGTEMTVGWSQFFKEANIRPEQQRILFAMVKEYPQLLKVMETVNNASGKGLDLAAKVAAMPVPAQWQMFKNILNEVGQQATEIGTPLQKVMGWILDFGKGLLVAVDSTGQFAGSLKDLGSAGKFAYEMMNTFINVGKQVAVALYPFYSVLKLIFDVLIRFPEILQLIVYYIEARLVLAFISWASQVVIVNRALITMHGILEALSTGALVRFLGKMGLVLGAMYAFTKLYDYMSGKGGADVGKYKVGLLGLDRNTLEQEEKALTKQRDTLKAQQEEAKKSGIRFKDSGELVNPSAREAEKSRGEQIAVLDQKLAALRDQMKATAVPGAPPATGGGGKTTAPEVGGKSGRTFDEAIIGKTKQTWTDILQETKKGADTLLKTEDDLYRSGKVSIEDYYNWRIKQIKANEQTETDVIKMAKEEVLALYETQESNVTKRYKGKERVNALKALEASRMEFIEQMNKRELEVTNNTATAVSKAEKEKTLALQNETKKRNALQIEINRVQEEAARKNKELAVDWQRQQVQNQYQTTPLGALTYYEAMKKAITEHLAIKKEALEKEKQYAIDTLNEEQTAYAKGAPQYEEIERKKSKTYADFANKRVDAEREATKEMQSLAIQAASDMELVYALGGPLAVLKTAWQKLSREFANVGEQWVTLAETTGKGVQSGFEDFFFDAFEGKLKNASDYFNSFLSSLNRAIAKFLSSQLMNLLMRVLSGGSVEGPLGGILKAFFPSTMTSMSSGIGPIVPTGGYETGPMGEVVYMEVHKGGVPGVDPVPMKTAPASIFTAAPRFHQGLKSNEYPAVLERGESVLTPGQMKAMGGQNVPNVIVNIENKTGSDVKHKETGFKFDGKKYVKTIVLELMQNDMGFRTALGK